MTRITNIDTLSAYLDRLITERIKWYFFNKEGDKLKAEHQESVVNGIKEKLFDLFNEINFKGSYDYLEERRTFNESVIVESLEELIINDINIGEADRARLEEVKKDNPNPEKFIVNEKRLRKANEGRARNKNEIDEYFKFIIE